MNTKEFLANVERIGERTSFTCPDCSGAIWQIGEDEPIKLRCHVGHSFTGEVFSAAQTENVENALWTAVRVMEEKVTFSRKMAERKRANNLLPAAEAYEKDAHSLDIELTKVRDLIIAGVASQTVDAEPARREH